MKVLSLIVVLAIVSCGQSHQVFTKEELAKFDGSDATKPIYLAIKGDVYDVSEGKSFYGKGGAYGDFGGADVSRAVAIWTKDKAEIDRGNDLGGLNKKQVKKLNDVIKMFKKKYKVIGIMDYKAEKLAQKEKKKVESTTVEL